MVQTHNTIPTPKNFEMHKSGFELWRLLKYDVDRAAAFNVISILESIRKMQAAKIVQDVKSQRNMDTTICEGPTSTTMIAVTKFD